MVLMQYYKLIRFERTYLNEGYVADPRLPNHCGHTGWERLSMGFGSIRDALHGEVLTLEGQIRPTFTRFSQI